MTNRSTRTDALARLARALVCALAVLAVTSMSLAGDDKDGGKNGGGKNGAKNEKAAEKEPKDTPEGKEAIAIGKEFASKDAAALVARINPDGKVKLALGDKEQSFAPDQAKGVLKDWFKGKGDITVELKKMDGNVGIFKLTIKTGEKTRTGELHVQISKKDKGDGYYLVRIERVDAT